jgi:hypothetical protein
LYDVNEPFGDVSWTIRSTAAWRKSTGNQPRAAHPAGGTKGRPS